MKGMILAGGTGTRLNPLTKVINKHLLPVGPNPMVYWPIMKLREAGITEILIVTNKEDFEDFDKLFGTGEQYGVQLTYKFQTNAGGIAEAVYLAKDFVKEDKVIVLLGDNIFRDSLTHFVEDFYHQEVGAKVLLKEVPDPQRYGVAKVDDKEKIITRIDEKPVNPPSNYCVVGIYMYDEKVFEMIDQISPSARGELEITDVNNLYISKNQLTYDILTDWWIDAGTHDALYKANTLIHEGSQQRRRGT